MQEREKKSPRRRGKTLSGEIKKNPFLFIRFALSLLLLLLHSSHCLPLTETGLQEKITASQLLIFPARYLFPSALSGTAHSLRRRKKLPHELILKSVKVQREMAMKEKGIRSVFFPFPPVKEVSRNLSKVSRFFLKRGLFYWLFPRRQARLIFPRRGKGKGRGRRAGISDPEPFPHCGRKSEEKPARGRRFTLRQAPGLPFQGAFRKPWNVYHSFPYGKINKPLIKGKKYTK